MKPDDTRTVYDGNLFDVVLERWGDHEREIVEHPGAVAIVAVDGNGARLPARSCSSFQPARSRTANSRSRARSVN